MKEDRILDLLEAADWEDIVLRLTDYARGRALRYSWRSRTPDLLPGGKTPEDVASEAIEKVWQGVRNWDPDKYPNLLVHLKWIVKSDIDHLFFSKEHQSTEKMMEWNGGQVGPDSSGMSPDRAGVRTPEEELIRKEEDVFEKKVKDALYALVKGDEDLEFVLLCIEEGMDKPGAIAKEMGWDVSKVNNLKKRLRRIADKAIKNVRMN